MASTSPQLVHLLWQEAIGLATVLVMPTTQQPHRRLIDIAQTQAGVFTRAQAINAGFTARQIRYRLTFRSWLPILTSVYVFAAVPITWTTWAWTGVLSEGDGSALVGASAAAVCGWTSETWPITIGLPADRRIRWPTARLEVQRVEVPADDIVRVSGLPITSRLRTAFDIAHVFPLAQAQELLDRLLVLDLIDLNALTEAIKVSRRHGSKQARRLMARAADLAASEAERTAKRLFVDVGSGGFVANYPVAIAGRTVKIDIAFLALKVAIEIKGWAFHSRPDRGRADEAKATDLQLVRWFVTSFTWHDLVARPEYVVAKVRQILRARAAAA